MTNSAPRQSRLRITLTIVAIGLILIAGTVLAGIQSSDRGLSILSVLATFGTALGTLGLAVYTFRLASVTARSVENAKQQARTAVLQLDEIISQRGLLEQQARSSENSTLIAERSRIDASAPLVSLQVSLYSVEVVDGDIVRPISDGESWYEAQFASKRMRVTLRFDFINIGASSAFLEFGGKSTQFLKVQRDRFARVVLQPGREYEDFLEVTFRGADAWKDELVSVAVTYSGTLFGSIQDHIHWNGWVKPLTMAGGIATEYEAVLNASSAQVIRSYPALEDPAGIEELRHRMLTEG